MIVLRPKNRTARRLGRCIPPTERTSHVYVDPPHHPVQHRCNRSSGVWVQARVCLDGEMRGVLGARRRDLVTQYFRDHTFLYRCNQNLPHKFTDP
jgi:hypothetical protein